MAYFCRNPFAKLTPSGVSMPIKTIPFDCMSVHDFCKKGISAWQGSQGDDQKFSTTAFPLKSARCSFAALPFKVDNVKSGAGFPMSGLLISPRVVVSLVFEIGRAHV